ncbi:hypothetical protein HDU98_000078 [Podochytrium sp. JEL0797]|nr:hypothetical protein HDU98_000078 [Podochytrium sp. JEL0797]
MPYPSNVETASAVESIIRSTGATPATIALLNGHVHIGLSSAELDRLGQSTDAVKASRRDLGVVLSKKWTGSTTVAATSLLAHLAGIKVFVTGGIGGVHRGGEDSLDVSADLTELSKTPVAVVCAGVKAILDIGRTLEYLETQGVPVVTYKSSSLPAFYTPTSKFAGIARMESPEECAGMIQAQLDLGMTNGSVIACPIPVADVEIDGEILDAVIAEAVNEAQELGVKGKDITPFLLAKVKDVTQGKSLKANVALIKNNALIGGQIAVALSKLNKQSTTSLYSPSPVACNTQNKIVIFGATNLDITSKFNASESTGKSASGTVRFSLGGVGRNMAEAAFRLGGNVHFVSLIADDSAGQILQSQMSQKQLPMSGIQILPSTATTKTAFYNGVLSSTGDCITGVADMTLHSQIGLTPETRVDSLLATSHPNLIAFDANVDSHVFTSCIRHACQHHIPCLFEATSIPKSIKLFETLDQGISMSQLRQAIHFVTPNALELDAMYNAAISRNLVAAFTPLEAPSAMASGTWETSDTIPKAISLSGLFPVVIVKLGRQGVLLVMPSSPDNAAPDLGSTECFVVGDKIVVHIPSEVVDASKVVSVTGAGDSLVGAVMAGIASESKVGVQKMVEILKQGVSAARLSLSVEDAVNEKLGQKSE